VSVLVLGTIATDTVKTPFGRKVDILGGSVVHFAMSCRLFSPVNIVAAVGEDFPQKYINFLLRKNINLTSLSRCDGRSFHWEGEYNGDMNAAITLKTELGVLLTFKPRIMPEQRVIKYVFLANTDPELQLSLLRQLRSPQLVALDTMNFWIDNKRAALLKMLKKVDIFVVNDQEARTLSGEVNLVRAVKKLRKLGPRMILIKKGEHGCLFYSDKFIFSLPAYPVDKVIDPTGAGDTFAGAFMGYLAKTKRIDEKNLKLAIAFGTVAASYNIEDFGVAKSCTLSLKDLQFRLNKFKQIISF